jgi:hypothetical protein
VLRCEKSTNQLRRTRLTQSGGWPGLSDLFFFPVSNLRVPRPCVFLQGRERCCRILWVCHARGLASHVRCAFEAKLARGRPRISCFKKRKGTRDSVDNRTGSCINGACAPYQPISSVGVPCLTRDPPHLRSRSAELPSSHPSLYYCSCQMLRALLNKKRFECQM